MGEIDRAERNRLNAAHSTGPVTPEGKAAIALNRVSHGIRSAKPVVCSSERPEDWEAHRAAIVADLAPAGALEQALAERCALILWRQARIVEAEADLIFAGKLNGPLALTASAYRPAGQAGDVLRPDEADLANRAAALYPGLGDAGARAAKWREKLPRLEARHDLARDLPGIPRSTKLVPVQARQLIRAACAYQQDGKGLPAYEPDEPDEWTAGALRDRLDRLEDHCNWRRGAALEQVAKDWGEDLEEARSSLASAEGALSAFRTLEKALTADLECRRALPSAGQLATISRYESHLSKELGRCLDRLRQLQADRRQPPDDRPEVAVGVVVRRNGHGLALNGERNGVNGHALIGRD